MVDSNAHSLRKWVSWIYYDENKKVVHFYRVQCIPRWMDTIEKKTLRVHLHQASALMLRQLWDDDIDTVLMESNAVAPEWGCNPFSSDFSGFKENSIASLQNRHSVDADAWCKWGPLFSLVQTRLHTHSTHHGACLSDIKQLRTMEFFLNVFTECAAFSDKNICLYSKRAQTCLSVTSWVKDQDATTVPAGHMSQVGFNSRYWLHCQLLLLEFKGF